MAGISAMGDLSHEIEALLINIDDGRIEPSSQIDDFLQQSIDELHRMRDMVIAGKRVAANTDLEKRIHGINAGEVQADVAPPAAEPEDVEVSEAQAFTIEPEDTLSMVIVDSPLDEDEESSVELPDVVPEQEADEPAIQAPPEPEPEPEPEPPAPPPVVEPEEPAAPVEQMSPAPTSGERTLFDAAQGRTNDAAIAPRDGFGTGATVDGPALITEDETTIVLPASRRAMALSDGCIAIDRKEG